MGSLVQELADDRRLGKRPCIVCEWIKGQSLPDQDEWNEAMAEPSAVISHTSLLRAMERRGVSITVSSIKRHRSNHA